VRLRRSWRRETIENFFTEVIERLGDDLPLRAFVLQFGGRTLESLRVRKTLGFLLEDGLLRLLVVDPLRIDMTSGKLGPS
jgi:hypothetical protein